MYLIYRYEVLYHLVDNIRYFYNISIVVSRKPLTHRVCWLVRFAVEGNIEYWWERRRACRNRYGGARKCEPSRGGGRA